MRLWNGVTGLLLLALTAANAETGEVLLAGVIEAADRRDPDAAVWTAALASTEPAVLAQAALGLGRIGGEPRLRALLPLLGHDDATVRRVAAFAVGIVAAETPAGQTVQEQALLNQLASETDSAVRQTLLLALGNGGGEAAQTWLAGYPIDTLPAAEQAAWAQAVGLLWSYRRGALAAVDAGLVKRLLALAARPEPVAEMAAFALARARKEPVVQQQEAALRRAFGQSESAGARLFLLRALAATISEKNGDQSITSWLRTQQTMRLAGRSLNAAERQELQAMLVGNLPGKRLRPALASALRQPAAAERLAAIQALSNRPAELANVRDVLQAHAALQPADQPWLAPLLAPPAGHADGDADNGAANEKGSEEGNEPVSATPRYADARQAVGRRYRLHTVRGAIDIELLPDALYTAANFAQLAERGFYNGTTFHRVIGNFVAQGGDPTGTGEGGPGWRIREELSQLPHAPGYVGMATAGKDTGGSQFFINTGRNPHLDWHYTVFARVIAGQERSGQLLPGDAVLAVTRLP